MEKENYLDPVRLSRLQKRICEVATTHGWYEQPRTAYEFFKERFSFEDSWHVEGETTILDKIIEDFKKYMEE